MNESNNGETTLDLSTPVVADVHKLSEKTRKPYWLKRPHENAHDFVRADGTLDAERSSRAPRRTLARTIDGFCEQLGDYADDDRSTPVRVFVGSDDALAVFDDRETRADRIRLPIIPCESFVWLKEAKGGRTLSQHELEWLLRTDFAGAFGPETLLPVIRKLRFKRNDSGEKSINHGKESMGTLVEQEVAGVNESDIPEVITLSTAVYSEIAKLDEPLCQGIRCALRVNVQDNTFTIKPLEGEVERAEARANRAIVDMVNAGVGSGGSHEHIVVFPFSAQDPRGGA